jgi:protein tyrosine phosphatase
VYQYHFTDWPDHGVPYYILPVLTFIKKSSKSNPEFGGPIVVHCSAGVGRTGTYIVIDAMMKQIKHKSTVNIHTFLKHIRHQRNYLVQTEEQFIFIYDCILESIKSGETEMNEHNYKSFLNTLFHVTNEDGVKLIDSQFELITEYKPKDYHVSFAYLPFNLSKNRSQHIVPVNNSRVVLSRNPGLDGGEYINASYLQGSSRQDEFIVTQYPTEETRSSFWQMVWDNNSNIIVVLNSDETEKCGFYWLPLNETMKCDSFNVILKEENFDIDFVIRDFLLQSLDEDYEFNCRMISASYWPDSCAPIKSAFDLINKVRAFRTLTVSTTNTNSAFANANLPPIIVHDLNGGFRACAFCALYTFQDLVQIENCVNVYELAKIYHLKRPQIWANKKNIIFLYEAVECLFDEMHTNNQHQFKNYLNMNIDSHLSNMMSANYSNNFSNPELNGVNTYSSSLTLLPNLVNEQNSNKIQTVTLPAQQKTTSNTRNSATTDAVGSRLQNFNLIQKSNRNSTNLTSEDQKKTSEPKTARTSFMDLPRNMLPAFLSTENSSDTKSKEPRTSNSKRNVLNSNYYYGTKAYKLMNTMRIKSVSFKRALFNQKLTTLNSNNKQEQAVQEVKVKQLSEHSKQFEQKPSMILASTPATSSVASSSSSTAETSTESSIFTKKALSPSHQIPVIINTNRPSSPSSIIINNSKCSSNRNSTIISTQVTPIKSTSVSKEKINL